MGPILDIADKHRLKVIEDCAQAHGARYKGRLVGTFGHAAGFSNQVSKPLSSGCQGGLFITNDIEIWAAGDRLQYFGERVTPGREREEQVYNAHGLSYMYRGDMFSQAFVRSQLKRLDEMNAQRIANCEYLSEQIRSIPGISPPVMRPDAQTVYFNYIVGFSAEELGLKCSNRVLRDKAIEALNAEGMRVGLWQRLTVPAQKVFQDQIGFGKGVPWSLHERKIDYSPEQFPVANRFLDEHVYIYDISPPNGRELMDYYAKAIRKVMAGIGSTL
jgi:dTDP-4-amino-4,6-dideoxygalactose transaminase